MWFLWQTRSWIEPTAGHEPKHAVYIIFHRCEVLYWPVRRSANPTGLARASSNTWTSNCCSCCIIRHSEERAILLHVWTHRRPRLSSVTVINSGQSVCKVTFLAPGYRWLWHCRDSDLRSPDDKADIFPVVQLIIALCRHHISNQFCVFHAWVSHTWQRFVHLFPSP